MRIANLPRNWALLASALFLASLSLGKAAPRYLARSWQSEDGLPSNVLRAVAQAADGYLWVGTAEGVVRFDGQRFTGFRPEADTMPSRLPIRALFPLANGEVWVTTDSNELLRGSGARLEEVPLPGSTTSGAPGVSISQVVLGEQDDVIIVRDAEIWRVAGKVVERLAARTASLDRLLQKDAAIDPERGRAAQGELGVRLRSARGELWAFKRSAGLTLTDSEGRAEPVSLQIEPPSAVRAMLEDREGNLWLATDTQGLWRVRPARVEVLTTADGLSDRAALLVFEDRAGALWGAPQAGLDRFSAGAAQHFEIGPELPRRPVSALLETQAGVLWAATRDGQVYPWHEPYAGWGQMLPRFFQQGVAVSNQAESGLALHSFARQKRLEKILSMMKKGDHLFIQFGHNDQKDKSPGAGPFTSYQSNLRKFVEAVRGKGGIPVLVTPMERRRFDENGQQTATLADYAEAVRQVGTEGKVPVIDLNAMSLKLYAALGPEKSTKAFVHFPAGTFPGQVAPLKDDTHFTAYGGYELARCVVEGIRAAKLDLVRFFAPDVVPFDPGHPDYPDSWTLPASPLVITTKPEGN